MNTSDVALKSWNRFLTRNLVVAPEVIGQRHAFSYAGASVCVQIPDLGMTGRPRGYDEVASSGTRLTSTGEVLNYYIHKVDLEVSLSISRAIPEEVLTRPPNAIDLFTASEQENLDALAGTHRAIAVQAFAYWLRVVRWVTDDSRIGQAEVSGTSSGWATYLKDSASNARVWAATQTLTVDSILVVTQNQWLTIQEKLEANTNVPVYDLLRHDALQSLRNGDYASALLFAAMSSETYLRFTVHQHLPEDLSPTLVKHVEKARIFQYYDEFFPEIVCEDAEQQYQSLKSRLRKLFERRNKLVHSGDSNGLDRKLCLEFIKTTKELQLIRLKDG